MERINRTRIATFLAILYILIAFGWWSVLLMKKSNALWEAKVRLVRSEGSFSTEEEFLKSKAYEVVCEEQRRQTRMIWSEGCVLFLGLIWGVWAINRSFQRDLAASNQRRNFLLSITHELKSPLASIQLAIQTLQKRRLDEEKTRILLQSAEKESERLNELVNNLLLSAKLETAYEPVFEEININNLLEELLSKMKMKFPKVAFHFDKKELPILRGDRQGIISVFNNLLENAVKYSPDQPVIHLKNGYENERFVFEVADNGVGVPALEKKKIFEKFYRSGNEETRKTKGTGLGLFIVSQVVKAHHGSIFISDNQPKGTVFKVVLPQ